MKHFDIWLDQADQASIRGKVLIERGVGAPSFRDACSLTFGDHIWFDADKLTFRGQPIIGKCKETGNIAGIESAA